VGVRGRSDVAEQCAAFQSVAKRRDAVIFLHLSFDFLPELKLLSSSKAII